MIKGNNFVIIFAKGVEMEAFVCYNARRITYYDTFLKGEYICSEKR